METLEFRLGLAVMTLVLNGLPIGIGVEELQTHVDTNHAASVLMLDLTLCLKRELTIVAIGAAHDANALDLFDGKGFDVLPWIANQAKAPNAAAIDEGDVVSIWI